MQMMSRMVWCAQGSSASPFVWRVRVCVCARLDALQKGHKLSSVLLITRNTLSITPTHSLTPSRPPSSLSLPRYLPISLSATLTLSVSVCVSIFLCLFLSRAFSLTSKHTSFSFWCSSFLKYLYFARPSNDDPVGVCMCVCVCVQNVCIYTCIHAYMHTYIHAYMHTYIHTHTYIFIYLHTYTYIHTYIMGANARQYPGKYGA